MNYIAELRRLVGSRPLILPGTSVVLVDDNRILLVKRTDTGNWGLPGGFMDPGETFEDTGRREVREEIGLEIDGLELLGVFSGPEYYYRYPHGDEVFNVTVAYTARPGAGKIKPDHTEVGDVKFFEPTELPADILGPEKPILERYLSLVTYRPTPQGSG